MSYGWKVKKPRTLGHFVLDIFAVDYEVKHTKMWKSGDFVSESSIVDRSNR